ncbi:MAG TPA: hypothetical protein VF762_05470 [Blastocatellia bacterium]
MTDGIHCNDEVGSPISTVYLDHLQRDSRRGVHPSPGGTPTRFHNTTSMSSALLPQSTWTAEGMHSQLFLRQLKGTGHFV